MLQTGKSRVLDPIRRKIFFSPPIYVILQAAPGPRVYSASKRYENQKYRNNVSGE
jgi:hypothetical protein